MQTASAVAVIWLASSCTCWAQNCVISGGTNFGTIQQNCIIAGPTRRLVFDPAIAQELAKRLSPGKPIVLDSVGSTSDQDIATQYQRFLESQGFHIAERNGFGAVFPAPQQAISIEDKKETTLVTIAPTF